MRRRAGDKGGPHQARYRFRGAGSAFLGCLMLASVSVSAPAMATADAEDAATPAADASAADPPMLRSRSLRFRDTGVATNVRLDGVDNRLTVPFGIRADEVVRHATLELAFAASPALIEALSHLRISLNGTVIASPPLVKAQAGSEVRLRFDIDPRLFTDFNQLQLTLIGHYTEQCADPQHSGIWTTISADSRLLLRLAPLRLQNDLALLPAPFFDRRDGRRLDLPLVFAAAEAGNIDLALARSAAVLASWFGAMADYRGARFPVATDRLPGDSHAVVFLRNGEAIGDWRPEPVSSPTVRLLDHPEAPFRKLLLLQGENSAEIDELVTALTLGEVLLGGDRAQVEHFTPPARLPAYENPRWLSSRRPVRFGELVEDPSQLRVSGLRPDPIRINLRLAPDLFTWRRDGIPIDLRYRYTSPPARDNSQLAISINGEFVQSIRLKPDRRSGDAEDVAIPLLEQPRAGSADAFLLPAFRAGADNVMEYRFLLDAHRSGPCASYSDFGRAAIDPDSTIDLRDFPNYTAMPELAHFANASFPFTRYADLAETVAVLPSPASAEVLEQLFYVVGRAGRHTGVVGSRLRLMSADALPAALDADLLVLDDGGATGLAPQWRAALPVRFTGDERWLQPRPPARWYRPDIFGGAEPRQASEVALRSGGAMAALVGFESPLQKGRSVVMLGSDRPGGNQLVLDALADDGMVRQLRGDLVLFNGRQISAHRGAERYYVGRLSPWQRLLVFVGRHPLLVVLMSVAGALLLALVAHGFLARRARRRLETA